MSFTPVLYPFKKMHHMVSYMYIIVYSYYSTIVEICWNYRNSGNYWRHPLNHITLRSEAETHRKCRYEWSCLAMSASRCQKVTERSCVVGAVWYLRALKKYVFLFITAWMPEDFQKSSSLSFGSEYKHGTGLDTPRHPQAVMAGLARPA